MSLRLFGVDSDQLLRDDLDTKTTQRLRAASISAAKVRNSTGSQSSNTSVRFKVQPRLSESCESVVDNKTVTSANFVPFAAQKSDVESIGSSCAIENDDDSIQQPQGSASKRAEFRKMDLQFHSLKDAAKGSNSSMSSIQSLELSMEKVIERPRQLFSSMYKIPPLSPFLQSKLNEFINFNNVSSSWSAEWCYIVWKNILCIFGNVNRISIPYNHVEMMKCLVHNWETFEKGLVSEDYRVHGAIMMNAPNIFTVLLPGSRLLIPAFFVAIKTMVREMRHVAIKNPPMKFTKGNQDSAISFEKARDSSYQLLVSILTFPSSLDTDFPLSELPALKKIDDYGSGNNSQVVTVGPVTSDSNWKGFWNSETSNSDPSSEMIDEGINCLLDHLLLDNVMIVNAAADSLIFFAREFHHLDYVLDLNIAALIVEKILNSILHQLQSKTGSAETKEIITSKLLSCLEMWLMIKSSELLSRQRLSLFVFDVLDQALKEADSALEYSGGVDQNQPTEAPTTAMSGLRQKSYQKEVTGSTGKLSAIVANHRGEKSALSNSEEDDDENLLKDSIENVMVHIFHHYNNFSPPFGPVIMCSQILESILCDEKLPAEKVMYFSVNDFLVLGCSDVVIDSKVKNRLITRDRTGRYVWENSIFYELHSPVDQITEDEYHELKLKTSSVNEMEYGSPKKTYLRNMQRDKLDDLLLSIERTYSECLNDAQCELNSPNHLSEVIEEAITEINVACKNQSLQEAASEPLTRKKVCSLEAMQLRSPKVDTLSTAELKFASCKVFLSHTGHFNFDSLKEGYMHPLTKTPSLLRDIKGLDKKYGREAIKVALLYVGPGQEDESCILRNSTASFEFKEFVATLGWKIDIATHAGYLGGLERTQSSGLQALYYCDHSVEMIFHDTTQMPTDPNDTKQVKKVLNAFVCRTDETRNDTLETITFTLFGMSIAATIEETPSAGTLEMRRLSLHHR
ncbi:Ral GTPase-activating protein subunit alpha-2 [Entophlyctis sp. JEL0112]|nr:Ral GTPase-activating protein subunit alpha-2 [Entophlyctis sp. JEL0112]